MKKQSKYADVVNDFRVDRYERNPHTGRLTVIFTEVMACLSAVNNGSSAVFGQKRLIAHDRRSLREFITQHEGLEGYSAASLKPWRDALAVLDNDHLEMFAKTYGRAGFAVYWMNRSPALQPLARALKIAA